MVVSVLHKLGQALPQFLAKPNLLGDRLSDRLRSATFAMLGLTTAVGLGLIAFVLQQGWPSVLGGPIPGFPGERSEIEATSQPPPAPNRGTAQARRSDAIVVPAPVGRGGAEPADSRLAASRQVAAGTAPTSPGPTGNGPPGDGVPGQQPSSQPPAPAPAPAPTAAPTAASSPSQSASATGSLGDGKGKGKGKGSVKSEDRGKGKVYSAPKPSPPRPKEKPRSSEPPAPVKEEPPTAGYAEDPYEDMPVPASEGKGKGKGSAYGHYK